ncbi:hypothetical protein SPRG_20460 [Saprolegnia parasitica CBS 223.65]|uniref:Uncharacterized protein n=1 Tax=Saprolegnia parasitica (strain CBS 223.65) TaxID=695850 RepID=A0A067CK28_SAPPC|nr:hypothetical protein SPRG_20460 [Saprolegnia parasitica CBS 223.65]KDO27147.1 hypothetical protein SPRG_20460 [Saprolegnia parasitica CBS 223.65]|eukprot:XP_012202265.1 hypothetical protein SPRG_20460 [Saprolegnia parasitica CBS 223.65]
MMRAMSRDVSSSKLTLQALPTRQGMAPTWIQAARRKRKTPRLVGGCLDGDSKGQGRLRALRR